MIIQLGTFEVTSGKVVVTDPCYELGKEAIFMGTLDHVLNGTWYGEVEKTEVNHWGEVCAKLLAFHSSFRDPHDASLWTRCDFMVSVDSGQAGVFDISKYRVPDTGTEAADPAADSDWYLACCDITEEGEEAGVIDGGVVSRSGMGDGGYKAFVALNEDRQVIGVKIVFIQ
ncbi:DUF4241 domain-containing protein [Paenibacillus sp. y28]|uniref:DUF4241 domain-containing protein n=1 Tax=Paenibacillus sp. y28 TaxID=3129110 RepID=UPI00301A2FD7